MNANGDCWRWPVLSEAFPPRQESAEGSLRGICREWVPGREWAKRGADEAATRAQVARISEWLIFRSP